jgi:hypothetical protein
LHGDDQVRSRRTDLQLIQPELDGPCDVDLPLYESSLEALLILARTWQPASLRGIQTVQSADNSGLDESACLRVKNIGKPCVGKLQARFDEGG